MAHPPVISSGPAPLSDSVSLGVARELTRKHAEKGTICPVCTQHVKVYRRRLNSGMARSLIGIYMAGGTDWVHVPTALSARSREEGKLAYWSLLEESKVPRDDGGRAGWWRVTPAGARFIHLQIRLPAYARVYNGKVLGFGGDPIRITDALGEKFDYNELMGR